MSNLPLEILSKAATVARGLAIDAVHASQSGHLGLPLGCAEIGAVLYGHALRHCPTHPEWLNRDRFVLSAGHGSMFLYAWLHLSGYAEVSLDEIKRFRQLDSKTPGHPELTHAPSGIEATTGPLGQGIGNAVGMAAAAKMAEARFNTPSRKIFDHHIVCLAGDGCMQEGVAMEAVAFAGHQRLDNLILIYDSNAVTLDAMAKETQSEDAAKRFEAIGFDVQTIEGHDMNVFLAAYERAKQAGSGKPQLIIAKTLIGKGIPEIEGTQKAHGEAGAKFAEQARKGLGLPPEHYYVSPEVRAYFAEHAKALTEDYAAWLETFEAWKRENPKLAAELGTSRAYVQTLPADTSGRTPDTAALFAAVPEFATGAAIATRKAGQDVLQPLAEKVPLLIGGSADLYGSTLNYIGDLKAGNDDFTPGHRTGRNIRFGIREHGMCAILNGIASHGIFRPSGATFLVFADYCRPPIRLASLSHLPVIYVFTHDSVGVGEDGPTHQPVETVPGLRVIPNLDVIRPADPEETAGAFVAALERTDGPTLLALTRQVVPHLTSIPASTRRNGVLKGGYIAKKESAPLDLILLSAGSELQHALSAAESLGAGTRVVSMPCFSRFDRQPAEYREEVLPRACRLRLSIEATVPSTWARYVGLDGESIGIERFGLSAPGGQVMKTLGITADHVIKAAGSFALAHRLVDASRWRASLGPRRSPPPFLYCASLAFDSLERERGQLREEVREPCADRSPVRGTSRKSSVRRASASWRRLGRPSSLPVRALEAVFDRDGARCSYRDDRGERCPPPGTSQGRRETFGLEVHHRHAHALGGPATLDNLELMCRAHNTLAAEQDFGRDYMDFARGVTDGAAPERR